MSQQSVPSWITEVFDELTRLQVTESKAGISVEGSSLFVAANITETPALDDIVTTDGSATLSAVGSKTAVFRNLDGSPGLPILTPNSDSRKFKVFGWRLNSIDTFVYTSPSAISSDLVPQENMVDGDFDTAAQIVFDNNDARNTIIDFTISAVRPLLIKVKATIVNGDSITNVVTSTATASGGPFTQIDTRVLVSGIDDLFLLPAPVGAFRFAKVELVSLGSGTFQVTQEQFEISSPVSPTVTSSDWTAPEEAKMVDQNLTTFGRVTDTGTKVETAVVVDFGAATSQTPKARLRANTTVGTSNSSFILGVSNSPTGPFTAVSSGSLTDNVTITIGGAKSSFQFMQLLIQSFDAGSFTTSHDVFQMFSEVSVVNNPTVTGGNITGPNIVDGNPATFETITAQGGGGTTVDFGNLVSRNMRVKFEGNPRGAGAKFNYRISVSDGITSTVVESAKRNPGSIIDTNIVGTFRFATVQMNTTDGFPSGLDNWQVFLFQSTDEIFTTANAVTSSPYTAPEAAKIIDGSLTTFATRSVAGGGVSKSAVFDSLTVGIRNIYALIKMTHTSGQANNTFLVEKSDDNVTYTTATSGTLISGIIREINVTAQSFRFLRISLNCTPVTDFTVDDDIFEIFTYTNPIIFSSEFNNSTNIIDGDLTTFGNATVNNATTTHEVLVDFASKASRQLQAKVNITLDIGSGVTCTGELLTADAAIGPFTSRSTTIIPNDQDIVLDGGTHDFQFAKLILQSTAAVTFQATSKVFEVYDRNILEPFNDSLVKIGTSDTQDTALTDVVWEQPLGANDTVLMPPEYATLIKNKFLTMQTTEHKTGSTITLDRIYTADQNVAL